MSDIRKNFLTEETVLMAEKRENRPMHFKESEEKRFNINPADCSFCTGNEDMTPGILYESPNKNCRVIKNKYPAIDLKMGFHEVIIDTNDHTKRLFEHKSNEFLEVLIALKLREAYHHKNTHIKYVQIFKNDGKEAGASIEHSHFQLLAMNYIPEKINTITKNFKLYNKENNGCYLCEIKEGVDCFTFYSNKEFRAVTMYDSIYAYGVDIIPKQHFNMLSDLSDSSLLQLSDCLLKALKSLEKIKNNINYNILFYSNKEKDFHFHLKIIPRIGKFGGFELASGNYINSVLPEQAMEKLKKNIEI